MPEPASPPVSPPGGDDRVPAALALAVVVVHAVLLTVWSAFLVPLRVFDVAVLVWLLPMGVLLALSRAASHSAGRAAVLAPGMVWLALSWLVLATVRPEGDLVVPATLPGYGYLGGGLVLWLVLLARTPDDPRPAERDARPDPSRGSATPAAGARR
ncbi:MAG: hypothetical protein ACLGIG_00920 [Actinomycetes bacterium]